MGAANPNDRTFTFQRGREATTSAPVDTVYPNLGMQLLSAGYDSLYPKSQLWPGLPPPAARQLQKSRYLPACLALRAA